jgi:hypothetical protein
MESQQEDADELRTVKTQIKGCLLIMRQSKTRIKICAVHDKMMHKYTALPGS